VSPKQFAKRQQTQAVSIIYPHKTLLTFRSVEYIKHASGTYSETEESVHTLTAQFFKTYFKIISTLTLGLPSFLYPNSFTRNSININPTAWSVVPP
jgi:hypothetical protein